MTTILKRGNVYHFAVTKGGTRLRCSLGVSDSAAAKRLANRVEFALADGPKSAVWGELRPALPAASFKTLTDGLSVSAGSPSLKEFEKRFAADLSRRTQLGQITESTARLYSRVCDTFLSWLTAQGIGKMDGVFDQDVDDYLLFRRKQLLARNPGKGARGLETESKILQAVLSFAVSSGAIQTSPLEELYKSDVPAAEPEPFTAAELQLMDDAAEGETRLVYLLMRWTGLRVSDVAALPWGAVNFDKRTLTWLTQKRKKLVCIPLSNELMAELEKYRGADGERIIPGATRAKLYTMIKALGEKAGVENVHPHRFRANFACFLLSKGATLHDVAEILGDKTSTVEVYYARFTDGAKDRIRNVLSS
jgi:integrase